MRVALTVFVALLAFHALDSSAGPIVAEEKARLSSPDPQLPLNGPVAMHGDSIVAGSILEVPESGDFRCVVFLFERPAPGGAWSFVRTLTDFTVPGDRAASFLALDAAQNVVIISARDRASVFERTAAGWTETRLALEPGLASDFGADGAITPAYAVVSGTFNGRLAAFVYRRAATGQWPLETRILADPQPISDNDYLGEQVDASGEYILLGAPANEFDPDGIGRLIVFSRGADGAWREEAALEDTLVDPSSPRGRQIHNQPQSILSFAGNVGLAAYRNREGGATVFVEDDPDRWGPLENVRSPDALMNRIHFGGGIPLRDDIGPVVLNTSPAPIGLASGTPGDEDRGFSSGSVTVFAPQSGFEAFKPVVKFLASDSTSELGFGQALGHAVAFHGNTLVATGRNRAYVFEAPSDLTQPAVFQDDFEDDEASGWLQPSPVWTVASSRGSRVYRQTALTGEHISTRGGLDWTNIAIEADVRPLAFNGSDRWVALMGRSLDRTHYYSVSLRNTNTLRLDRRVGTSYAILASRSFQVTPGRSYRVRMEAVGTWLRAYVDGQLMLQARDSTHTHGGAGFRTAFAQAEFDNIVISPNPSVTLLFDNFESEGFFNVFDWTTQPAANWTETGAAGSRVLRQSVVSGTAQAISGIENTKAIWPEAADQVVQARLRALSFSSGSDPRFGLIARYRDDANYTFVTLHRNGYILLRELNNGVLRFIDRANRTISAGTWYTVRLETVGDRLRVYLNNVLVLEGRDGQVDPVGTRFGLLTAGTSAEFDNVRVTQP